MLLTNLQEQLQLHLLENDAGIVSRVTPPLNDTIEERLGIYNQGYRLRLLEALSIDYAILKSVMGEEEFDKLGYAYIDAYPSRYFSIDRFGTHLSTFLAEAAPYKDLPHLADLAKFIWALGQVVIAPDAEVLTQEEVASIPQDEWVNMRITLHPSVALLEHPWNVIPIWQAATADHPLPTPELLEKPAFVAVWRKDIQSFYNLFSAEEMWILRSLQEGKTFGDICEGLLAWMPEEEVAAYTVNLLLHCLQDGMLSGVSYTLS